MNGLFHPSSANGKYRVASLVRPLENLKSPAAKSKHLWHKRHAVEFALAVERFQDFLFAADFHPVAHLQTGCYHIHLRSPDAIKFTVIPGQLTP
jgi:hypothetical protein